ncbi:hypothetical protein E4U22_006888 [Claviceps purpurea]|nr:hypothetical protein E4U22_006888 [Claviceps purpurea]
MTKDGQRRLYEVLCDDAASIATYTHQERHSNSGNNITTNVDSTEPDIIENNDKASENAMKTQSFQASHCLFPSPIQPI